MYEHTADEIAASARMDALPSFSFNPIAQLRSVSSNPDVTPEPEPLSKFDQFRQQIHHAVTRLQSVKKAIRAPLPTETGDGSDLPPPVSESAVEKIHAIVRDLQRLGVNKIEDLITVATKQKKGEPLNDKDMLMEYLVQAAACLPPDHEMSQKITQNFVTQLWDDLQHPPQTLLGDEYQYRQPDGSKNNYVCPHIGAAGMPYARTASPMIKQAGMMPDPGTLFDSLMARKSPEGKTHPNKISSMLFYLASIIIHDVFKTNRDDFNISDTSSYLDLAPLYGSTWAEQKRMRTIDGEMKDGRIKPDCFSETRLLTFPPGVGALLIMFNRYHNYVVEQLAAINEGGRFTENPRKVTVERYGETINKRDDDLFQTARLITCGLYVNIILIDYVRTILNLNRTDDNWQLNPRAQWEGGPPVATGNQVSAEFNLVYRWHAAISHRDDLWTQELFKEMVEPYGMNAETAGQPENIGKFLGILGKKEAELKGQDPLERAFPTLQSERLDRVKEGPFKDNYEDDDLAKIITAGIEDCANAMGPQQVPTVLRAIEILGIMQARTWQCATLNEFRKRFSLLPHRKFSDITENVEVQEALRHLYDTPDNVELYPGLVVEDAKRPMAPGSGLCPSYTISRGVLSDATALVRGDRFFTSSYTPASLTNWGYQEVASDPSVDNGCVMYKLLLRGLPNNYDPASAYVHYPFTVPHGQDGMHDVLKRLGKDKLYNFEIPRSIAQPKVIFSYKAADEILHNQKAFKVTWGAAMEFLQGPVAKNYMLAGDGPKNDESRKLIEKDLFLGSSSRAIPSGHEPWLRAVRTYYENITTKLLRDKSYSLAGTKQVDIIRDVGNMAHVHFSAELFSIPLKTEDSPHGLLTEQQLYLIDAAMFICIFFDLDPAKSFPLRQQAYEATQQLGQFMKLLVEVVKHGRDLAEAGIARLDPVSPELSQYGIHMIRRLCEADPDTDDLVWGNILMTADAMVLNQGQLFGQVLDFFMLVPYGQEHWPEVQRLARQDTADADDKLLHYFLEASRLNGETGVFRYVDEDITIVDKTEVLGEKTYHFQKGDKIMLNLKAASRDPTVFPNPDTINLDRAIDSYIHFGHGPHQCLGLPMTRVALTTMLKVIARLENLRPATVAVGARSQPAKVKKVLKEFTPGDLSVIPESWHYNQFLTEDWDMYFPFPISKSSSCAGCISLVRGVRADNCFLAGLKVTYTGEVPDVQVAKPNEV